MRVLLWHVHGSWTTAFVQGTHDYVVPVLPGRGPNGRGRARTWDWPAGVVERPPSDLAVPPPDVVLLQRPHEAALLQEWTGLRAGRDVAAVYVEHDTPRGDVEEWRHHLAGQSRIPVVHVTHFNRAMWDTGRAPTHVIEHGILDPGPLWTGVVPRLSMSVNEPVRRWRVAGMDLAEVMARRVQIDVYGMGSAELAERTDAFRGSHLADLPQRDMHRELARHRAYVHPYRWTSLGLSLLEAMALGSPVLVLNSTAASEAVHPDAGVVSSDPRRLVAAAQRWLSHPDEAAQAGRVGRVHTLRHYGCGRFLADWDDLLKGLV